jgi:glucan 1,3-beta-glucosidase
VLVVTNSFRQITEIYLFAGVLVLQSLPFMSAVALATLELSRINSFAFWRHARIRTAELIGLRPVPMPTPVGAQRQVTSDVARDTN